MTESDPTGKVRHEPGAKLDKGKPSVMSGFFHFFPRAIRAVTEASDLGARDYAWGGWKETEDARRRYGDAMARHSLEEDFHLDDKTGLLSAAHTAWNALARLELILTELEDTEHARPEPLVPIPSGPAALYIGDESERRDQGDHGRAPVP